MLNLFLPSRKWLFDLGVLTFIYAHCSASLALWCGHKRVCESFNKPNLWTWAFLYGFLSHVPSCDRESVTVLHSSSSAHRLSPQLPSWRLHFVSIVFLIGLLLIGPLSPVRCLSAALPPCLTASPPPDLLWATEDESCSRFSISLFLGDLTS
jgi:hypothetical protein